LNIPVNIPTEVEISKGGLTTWPNPLSYFRDAHYA